MMDRVAAPAVVPADAPVREVTFACIVGQVAAAEISGEQQGSLYLSSGFGFDFGSGFGHGTDTEIEMEVNMDIHIAVVYSVVVVVGHAVVVVVVGHAACSSGTRWVTNAKSGVSLLVNTDCVIGGADTVVQAPVDDAFEV